MTTYKTGNPIGSASPKDLYDNSQNLDAAVNSQESTWADRLGVVRPTLKSAVDPTGLVQDAVDAAGRAEAAADAATVNSTVHPTIQAGLDAVQDGDYFLVIGQNSSEASRLHRRVDATNATLEKIYPTLEAIRNSQGLKQIKYTGAYDPDRTYQEDEAVKFNDDYYYAHNLTATYKNQVKNPRFNAVGGSVRYGWSGAGITPIAFGDGKYELSMLGDKPAGALIITQTTAHNVPAQKNQVWSASIEVENKSAADIYVRLGILVTGSETFFGSNTLVPAGSKVVVKQEGRVFFADNTSAARILVHNGTGQIIPAGAVLVFRKPMLNIGQTALDYFDGFTAGTSNIEYSWEGEPNNSLSVKTALSAPSKIPPPDTDGRWIRYVGDVEATNNPEMPMHTFVPVKVEKSTQQIPSYYTLDRTIGFNVGSSNLNQTFDDGETWELLHQFAGSQTDSVRQLENGELFVTTSNSAGASAWVSSGFASGGSVTFTKTLDAHSKFIKWPGAWSIFDDGNLVAMIDYGGKAGMEYAGEIVPDGQNARFAYLSLDFGKTWKTIFDLNKWVVDNGYGTPDDDGVLQGRGVHCHGIAYDKWWNRLWITFGDNTTVASINSIGGTCYSDNFGGQWKAANWGKDSRPSSPTNSYHQLVGIWPMPECILFGTDSAPNGVHRIERSQGKYPTGEYTINIGYAYSDEPMLTHLCQSITQSKHLLNQPAVFGFGAEGYARKSFIVATYDGFDFRLLWESEQPNAAGRGLRTVCGPTRMGNMVVKEIDIVSGASVITQLMGPFPVY
ncbi:hypothetical protein EYC51_17120 [Alcaligenes faecalis]|nr:hypothetical protein EYC51_17120 [Alcaligenes faecalis]